MKSNLLTFSYWSVVIFNVLPVIAYHFLTEGGLICLPSPKEPFAAGQMFWLWVWVAPILLTISTIVLSESQHTPSSPSFFWAITTTGVCVLAKGFLSLVAVVAFLAGKPLFGEGTFVGVCLLGVFLSIGIMLWNKYNTPDYQLEKQAVLEADLARGTEFHLHLHHHNHESGSTAIFPPG